MQPVDRVAGDPLDELPPRRLCRLIATQGRVDLVTARRVEEGASGHHDQPLVAPPHRDDRQRRAPCRGDQHRGAAADIQPGHSGQLQPLRQSLGQRMGRGWRKPWRIVERVRIEIDRLAKPPLPNDHRNFEPPQQGVKQRALIFSGIIAGRIDRRAQEEHAAGLHKIDQRRQRSDTEHRARLCRCAARQEHDGAIRMKIALHQLRIVRPIVDLIP